MDLSYIASLLAQSSRLILPGLGAFLVKEADGEFQAENVSFSPFLKYNDQVLQNAIAKDQALTPEQAQEKVQAIVQHIQNQLRTNGQCQLPALGILKTDEFGAIAFHPDASIPPEATPLVAPVQQAEMVAQAALATKDEVPAQEPIQEAIAPIEASPAVQNQVQAASASTPDLPEASSTSTQPKEKPKTSRPRTAKPRPQKKGEAGQSQEAGSGATGRTLLILLLLVLLFGAGYGIADYFYFHRIFKPLPTVQEVVAVDRKAAAAGAETSAAVDQTPEVAEQKKVSEIEQEFNKRASLADGPEQAVATPTSLPKKAPAEDHGQGQEATFDDGQYEQVETKYPSPSDINIYHIILGSFQSVENAERQVQALADRGFNAQQIMRPDGMHAVVVGSFPSRGEAAKALSRVRGKYPTAWILQQ
ncbi:MAG: hypothetical protein CSA97_01345 [Bacteroidetes bacterium]|nr:MAG: hypothetical protein CSA97_01345 [Bacteroidota bacterium]